MTQVPKTAYLSAIHPRASELGALDSLQQDELDNILALVLSDGNIPTAFDNLLKYLKNNHRINLCVDIGDNFTQSLVNKIEAWTASNQLPSDYGICVPLANQEADLNRITTLLKPSFVAIRVKLDSRHVPQDLDKKLESQLKNKPANTDMPISLILDLGYIAGHNKASDSGESCAQDPDVQAAVTVCSNLLKGLSANLRNSFYQIFVLGGSFPRQISFVKDSAIMVKSDSTKTKQPKQLPKAEMAFHFRREYEVWQEIKNNSNMFTMVTIRCSIQGLVIVDSDLLRLISVMPKTTNGYCFVDLVRINTTQAQVFTSFRIS